MPLLLVCAILSTAPVLLAQTTPPPTLLRHQGDEVVVVFNSDSAPSREVALHYAQRRSVPSRNVVGWSLPTGETCSRKEFAEQLQKPLDAFLRALPKDGPGTATNAGGLPSHIRHVLLCYGVPTRIAADPTHVELVPENAPPALRRNEAAVDSELALLPQLPRSPPLGGPLANPVYGQTNPAAISPDAGVLMVARLDGPTPEIARGLVDKAIAAETNGLWGRAYFDLRGITNSGYQLGDLWLRAASEATRVAGFETIIDTRPETFPRTFPLSHVAFYAGWYDGQVSGPFLQPTVEFVPGALAYHLHSFSAQVLRTATNHWVGPLLARGATATLGYVAEPYLEGTADLGVLWSRLLQCGFSFGEAACAAQRTLSWQTIVVGDPLYRPFGRRPAGAPIGEHFRAQHAILESRQDPLLAWTPVHVVNVGLSTGLDPGGAVRYLKGLPLTATNSILLEKLGDLYQSQGKLAEAIDAHLRALQQPTTPQQRLRLLLQVARRQALFTQHRRALETYDQFRREFADYPDRADILQRMVRSAQELQDTNRVAALEAELRTLEGRR